MKIPFTIKKASSKEYKELAESNFANDNTLIVNLTSVTNPVALSLEGKNSIINYVVEPQTKEIEVYFGPFIPNKLDRTLHILKLDNSNNSKRVEFKMSEKSFRVFNQEYKAKSNTGFDQFYVNANSVKTFFGTIVNGVFYLYLGGML